MKNATFEDKLVTHNYKVKAWREEEKAGGDKKVSLNFVSAGLLGGSNRGWVGG